MTAQALKAAAVLAVIGLIGWAYVKQPPPAPHFVYVAGGRLASYDEEHARFLLEVGHYGYFYCGIPRDVVIRLSKSQQTRQFFIDEIAPHRCTDEDFSKVVRVDDDPQPPPPDDDPIDRL